MTGIPDTDRIATWLRVADFTAHSKGHVSTKAMWEVTRRDLITAVELGTHTGAAPLLVTRLTCAQMGTGNVAPSFHF